MRRAEIVAWGEPLEIHEYPTPEPTGSEVLVEVTACGICHSDLHIHQGYFDLGGGHKLRIEDRGMTLPFTMGHEVVGRVAKLGPDAAGQGVEVGREYIVYPWIGCGQCADCRRGDELLCLKPRIIGTWVHGGYADHVIVPHPRYLVPFDGIPREVAATYACSGITAWSALGKTGITRDDQTLLLIGAGGVGMNALHLAPAAVPGRVIVADVDPAKREAAREAGAAEAFDPREQGAARKVKDWTGGGCAAAIDFVGRPESAQFALDCLVAKGGTLVIVGLYGDRLALPLPLLPLRMLTLRGSYVGTLDDLKTVVALAQQGRVPFIRVTPRRLEEANQALSDLAEGRVVGRQVLVP